MTAADRLLERLERVGPASDDQSRASCPTALHKHGDRSRGLYVRQVDDRALVHCMAGCTPAEVCEAVGLCLADLFDHPKQQSREAVPVAQRWDFRALLLNLEFDTSFVATVADQMADGVTLNDLGREELQKCAKRIRRTAEVAR